ncbi:isoamylase early set domain-containing protein [Fulvivirgaceae bacterium BMA12]|uniref:Isoamylase early set domain-containing protein n=1 Tax=Agaribacillus aureus TaxID=3051825 RepID=A0ABT8LFA8_9BACT|nr:isoamylase early set domain-containing protein [Fulvivirgaceae bacterium BMA12]
MSLKKQYLKSKPLCKVTFSLPKEAASSAKKVAVVGEFNDWNSKALPMKKLKDGSFKITQDLSVGQEYQFKYLIDGKTWENDWSADKYVSNEFTTENSVVVL